MNSYFRGVFFIVLSAVCWSSAGLFIKLVQLPPVQIAMYRSLIAGVFLAGYIFYQVKKYRVAFDFSMSRASWITAICYFFTVSLFVTANKMTSSANAVFLQYTAPVYVILISFFILREKIVPGEILTVALCLVGMFLFFMEEEKSSAVLGNIFGILSGVAFALLQVFVKRFSSHAPPASSAKQNEWRSVWAVVLGNGITASISFLVIVTVFTTVSAESAVTPIFGSTFSLAANDMTGLLVLGIFQLGFGYLFFAKGANHISSVEIAIYTLLEPILNPVWTFIGTGEKPGAWALAGAGLIIVAMIVNTFWGKKTEAAT